MRLALLVCAGLATSTIAMISLHSTHGYASFVLFRKPTAIFNASLKQANNNLHIPTMGIGERSAREGQQQVWSRASTVVLSTPDFNQPLAHIGQNFPLTLLGATEEVTGQRWDHVAWSSPKETWSGWLPDSAITSVPPNTSITVSAAFDALSPDLSMYLETLGQSTGVAVLDITHQRLYTYNSNVSFLMASSMKVPIMLTYLDQSEQAGQQINDEGNTELQAMIENSDNDAASDLYYNAINHAQGVNAFLQKTGIAGIQPNDSSWGYSLTTPQAMVDLLATLQRGSILTSADRQLAFTLMENVEADQRQGLGDTAPAGATVALKDGWVPDEDGLWAVNTSGIITDGNETYILAAYTQGQITQDDGENILDHICSLVAAALI